MCIHKDLCNGIITTDKKIIIVFKFKAHFHEGDTDFISIKKVMYYEENYDLPSTGS